MRKRRVKEDMNYVVSQDGAIVLDNNNRYLEYIRQRNARREKAKEYESLKKDVSDLREMVESLLKEKKTAQTSTKKKS